MTGIVDILAGRLRELGDGGLAALAFRIGVPGRIARSAFKGDPVPASDFIRLCSALGIDPMTGESCSNAPMAPLNHNLLAVGFRLRMASNGHTMRSAGAAMETSRQAALKLWHAMPVSIGTAIKACRYIGSHPFSYCVTDPMKCETGAVTDADGATA